MLAGFIVQSPLTGAAASNPIVLENQQAGTTSWLFDNYNKAQAHEIEGYASLTSVNKGGQISFMVSLSGPGQYTMDFFRMGWYPNGTNPDGSSCAPSCGGRLMLHVGPLNGSTQAGCPAVASSTDPNYGMIECHWTPSYTLTVPTTWTTGSYLVKLSRLDNDLQNYMTFVVRDDSSGAAIVYSLDVNTWQAYNFWGGPANGDVGRSLYGRINDVTLNDASGSRAYTVSFDRPYLVQGSIDGAGNFIVWDFPLIRWMESQGYDMTYVTDVDLESNTSLLSGHRVFVNTGHDEYYSDNMRATIQNGIASGVNMAFFSANNIYQRVTWGSDYSGAQLRRVHDDKNGLPGSTTFEFRYLTPPRPENAILGVMQNGVATSRPFLVYDASSWIYAGTGLVNYTGSGTTGVKTSGAGQNALAGLVGYEFDERAANASSLSSYVSFEPAGLHQVGHSFVPASDNGVNAWSDATLYTAPSGATIFSAGTIQWPFAVDDGINDGFCDCDHAVASAIGQRITANILNRFITPTTAPAVRLSPSSLTFGSQQVGTPGGTQLTTLTNTGNGALTITAIGVSGANAGDFGQTNTCPLSPSTLAAGASCTISVTFTPTATGSRVASVQVTDNASDSPQSVGLSGTGIAPAVTLTPTSLSFGSQLVGTTSGSQSTTLTNTGTAPLSISSITIGGANPGDFTPSHNCPLSPSTLAVSASCTISATFTPSAAGGRSASVQVTDSAGNSPQSVPLSGTGTAPAPAVTLNPNTGMSFGNQMVGTTSGSQSVTLTNTGNAALSITSITVAGANPGDFSPSNNCPLSPSTLAAGSSCTLSATFTPTATGSRTASLSVADNASGSPHAVALNGTGTAPAVSLNPNTGMSFGNQTVGATSGSQSVTLTNSGTAPLSISSISLGGTNPGDFSSSNNCPLSPSTLAVNANCTISATFTPSALGGRSASLSIADNAAGNPQTVALSGTGVAPAPAVSLNPNTGMSFGNQQVGTTSGSQSVTLTNTGTAPLTITSITVAGANPGDFSPSNDCPLSPSTLAAGANCTLSATFTPTATGGRSASLSIADNAAGNPHSVALSGTGTAPAVSLNPNTGMNFGNQLINTTSGSQSVTLTNTGTAALSISSITIGGTNPADFSPSNNCPLSPSTLAVNASCTISATFTPTASGSRTASLSIADNASGNPHSVALSGTGVAAAPAVTLNPNTGMSFGNQQVGTTSSSRSVTLTNTGNAALSISGITLGGTNPGDFSSSNNCPLSPSTLAAGSSCTLNATFTPTATGSRTASLSIADNASGSPHAVALSGTGTAPAVSLNPTTGMSFGNQTVNTSSGSKSVTLTNSGTAPLTISSISIGGANPGDFTPSNNCPLSPSTLAVNANCTISATFTPSALGGRSASLSIADNAAGSPQAVALSGTGVAASAAIFSDGFESGSLPGAWTATSVSAGNSLTLDTTLKHSGNASLKAVTAQNSAGNANVSVSIPGQTTLDVRGYYYLSSPVNWGAVQLMSLYAQGQFIGWVTYNVDPSSPSLLVYNGANNTFYTCSQIPSLNAWHSIELQYVLSASASGSLALWLDGVQVCSATGIVTSRAGLTIDQVLVGMDSADPTVGLTVHIDDVVVSKTYIGG